MPQVTEINEDMRQGRVRPPWTTALGMDEQGFEVAVGNAHGRLAMFGASRKPEAFQENVARLLARQQHGIALAAAFDWQEKPATASDRILAEVQAEQAWIQRGIGHPLGWAETVGAAFRTLGGIPLEPHRKAEAREVLLRAAALCLAAIERLDGGRR